MSNTYGRPELSPEMYAYNWLFGGGWTPDPAMGDVSYGINNYMEFASDVRAVVDMFGLNGSEFADPDAPDIEQSDLYDLWHTYLDKNMTRYLDGCQNVKDLYHLLKHVDNWNRLYNTDLPEIRYDTSDFPVFGDNTPENTQEIYSWDNTHFLVCEPSQGWSVELRNGK